MNNALVDLLNVSAVTDDLIGAEPMKNKTEQAESKGAVFNRQSEILVITICIMIGLLVTRRVITALHN